MSANLWLAINGDKVVIPPESVDAGTTLNEFLRSPAGGCQGVKLGCGQGGCGACTVAVSEAGANGVVTRTVTSCLVPVVSVAGAAITTVEGLRQKNGEAHPIQTRFGHHFASQCGFCTPGMVMQMYGALQGTNGGRQASVSHMEKQMECGNLCRCTGYRPILDVAKSFCEDRPAGDLQLVSDEKGTTLDGPYDAGADPIVPDFIKEGSGTGLSLTLGAHKQPYCRATSVEEVRQFLKSNPKAVIFAGHTSTGIYGPMWTVGSLEAPPPVVDISRVPQLRSVEKKGNKIVVGASATLEELACFLDGEKAEWAQAMVRHLRMISGFQVRNRATVGGNVWATRVGKGEDGRFPSDVCPMLLALDATVNTEKSTPMSKWFTESPAAGEFLVSVEFEIPAGVFDSHRVALRPRNAKCLMNGAVCGVLDGAKVKSVRLTLGALKVAIVRRLPAVEAALTGKEVKDLVGFPLSAAIEDAITADFKDIELGESRRELASSLVAKFIGRLAVAAGVATTGHPVPEAIHKETKLHTSKITMEPCEDLAPFGTAGELKDRVEEQCGGTAMFCDDMAMKLGQQGRDGMLHAALITAQAMPNSTIKEIKPIPAEWQVETVFLPDFKSPVCKPVFGAETPMMFGVGDKVPFWGAPVGLVMAETMQRARWAADKAAKELVVYDAPAETEKAMVLVQEARAILDGGAELPESYVSTDISGKKGDPEKAFKAAEAKPDDWVIVKGRMVKNGQHHWYMEPNVVFIQVDEGNRLIVQAAAQNQDSVMQHVHKATGVPMCKLESKMRRCGGGFGGKSAAPGPLAGMAAVGAVKTGRSVRFVLPRSVDSAFVGNRERLVSDYTVLVNKKTQLIEAVQFDNLLATGFADSGMGAFSAHSCCGSYYIPNVGVRVRSLKSASQQTAAVRAPGHHEGALLSETMLDHCAHALGVEGFEMREKNILCPNKLGPMKRFSFPFGIIPSLPMHDLQMIRLLMNNVKEKSNYVQRVAEANAFNTENQFRKRGVGFAVITYGLFRFSEQTCLLNIYRDGSIVIHTSGCEIGQGLVTKAVMMAQRLLSTVLPESLRPLPKDMITVADANTQITPNRGGTGGSVTSEMVCFAVEDAASNLVDKLTKQKRKPEAAKALAEAAKKPTPEAIREQWQAAVADALDVSILEVAPYLTAVGRYKAALNQFSYETFCAACVEAEVDGLTGEYDLRHATVNFEGGVPFHGGIEMGQVEGSFMMGIGAMTTEEVLYEPTTGRVQSDNTWTYKIPLARDLPAEWNVELTNFTEREHQKDIWGGVLGAAAYAVPRGGEAKAPKKSRAHNKRLLSGKASGEPPLLATTSVVTALRNAIAAFGAKEFIQVPVPLTVDTVRRLCAKSMAEGKSSPTTPTTEDTATTA
mmetsp:Transcript_35703/g.75723  ORF Transcript_35703/g.75723 Transcript_35703/m.75723 type:complete len:1381 (+) Transcript_35703:71-4213(+)